MEGVGWRFAKLKVKSEIDRFFTVHTMVPSGISPDVGRMTSSSIPIGLHSHSRRKAFSEVPGYDVHRFLREAAAWGFQATEIITGKAGDSPSHIGTEDGSELAEISAEARELGVPITCFSTYNDFAFTRNESWRKANIRYIERWIELAAACGVPNLRYLTGYVVEGERIDRLEQLVIEATRHCAGLAEATGVHLALENHSSLFPYANDIARLLEAVASPALTTCPDPTNGFGLITPDTPDETRDAMLANLAALAPHATNAHLKVGPDALGGFPIGPMLEIYHRTGYQGAIQLELTDADAPPERLIAARERLANAQEVLA